MPNESNTNSNSNSNNNNLINNNQKIESFASVSSSIMMKIPTNNLTSLRSCFEERLNGLGLDDFLVAVVSNMELVDYSEMMLMVADLIDFFHLVDINGDGCMEWEEFVMFILDCVVQEKIKKKEESFNHILTRQVQSAAIRNPIISSMTVPALGKYLLGVGLYVQIYGPDERSLPSKTSLIYTINLIGSEKPLNQYLPGEKLITVIDMAYLDSLDILCILRSDMTLEFIKFLSRSNYSFETIDHIGKIDLDITCHKIYWRVYNNRAARLMAIGTSNSVHHWLFTPHGDHGTAELKDHRTMDKHTDFIRDILTVENEIARYVITASLDKSVILWDLQTLEYISTRTGHSAGVECLSFGGKNLLFAGGYDYTIIVWDLETTINRPLYILNGHSSCITKIVSIESIERGCSLDEDGYLIWWDISKNTPQSNSNPQNRVIEILQLSEDRARTFDIFSHLPYTYQCLYGTMILIAGRRQHIYHCKDCSIQESPPVCVLYSPDLLSIYTIHTHDIIFWSGVNGYSYKTINELVSIHSKISCGMLDDRKRRMILGDTNGIIRYYNCLNGVLLKVYPQATHSIKNMIYSPDKTLIVLLDSSDIYIYDDLVDISPSNISNNHGPNTDHILREMRIPMTGSSLCSDIISISYCHSLGLIATIDIFGLLIIWDYTYLIPEYIIPNVNGTNAEVCRLEFIPGYPILVIVDTSKSITLLTFKTLNSNHRMELWRLEPILSTTIEQSNNNSGNGNGNGNNNNEKKDDNQNTDDEGDDEIESSMGAKSKPLNLQKAKLFLKRNTPIERLVIHLEESNNNENNNDENNNDENIKLFPNNLIVRIVCGYKDGTISVTDITKVLNDINIGPILPIEYIQNQIGYNPRSKAIRMLTDSDNKKIISSDEITHMLKYSNCIIQKIWKPHLNNIISLSIIGEYNWLLIASDDCSVQLWTINAQFCGILTRGTTLDKLFRKVWSNPENMILRSQRRIAVAQKMVDELNLEQVVSERRNSTSDSSQISSHSLQRKLQTTLKKEKKKSMMTTDPKDLKELIHSQKLISSTTTLYPTSPNGNRPNTGKLSSPPSNSPIQSKSPKQDLTRSKSLLIQDIQSSLKKIKEFPDRTRLLCQLDGELTYDPSKKDIAYMQLKTAFSLPDIHNNNGNNNNSNGDNDKKRKRKKKKKLSILNGDNSNLNDKFYGDSDEKKYLETIKIANECLELSSKRYQSLQLGTWHYQNELAAIEAADPSNWDISSNNRFRSMYGNLYDEMTKRGVINDKNRIIETKIKHLCPTGNLKEYMKYLKQTITERKELRLQKLRDRNLKKKLGKIPSPKSSSNINIFDEQNNQNDLNSNVIVDIYKYENNNILDYKRGIISSDDYNIQEELNILIHEENIEQVNSKEELFPLYNDNNNGNNGNENNNETDDEEISPPKYKKLSSSNNLNKIDSKSNLLKESQYDNPILLLNTQYDNIIPIPTSTSASISISLKSKSKKSGIINSNLSDTIPYYDSMSPSEKRSEIAKLNTKETVDKFNDRLKSVEIQSKQNNRIRKKMIKKFSNDKKINLEKSLKNLHQMDENVTEYNTFDDMLNIGKKQLKAKKNWLRKVKETLTSDDDHNLLLPSIPSSSSSTTSIVSTSDRKMRPNSTSNQIINGSGNSVVGGIGTTSSLAPTNPKDFSQRYNSIRLFQTMVEKEKSENEKLLERQLFGPYKAIEILQFYEIFKLLPKKNINNITHNDTLLTSSFKEEETITNTTLDNEDVSNNNNNNNIISLHDLLKHKYIRSRPQIKTILEKNLIVSSSNRLLPITGGIYITLQKLLQQIYPLMTTTDRKELIKYFQLVNAKLLENIENQLNKTTSYTNKQLKQLKQIFDYFDIDKSGTVDRHEIKSILNRDMIQVESKNNGLKGSDQLQESGVDDASIESMVDEADVDRNNELDFDEFVRLFGAAFQT